MIKVNCPLCGAGTSAEFRVHGEKHVLQYTDYICSKCECSFIIKEDLPEKPYFDAQAGLCPSCGSENVEFSDVVFGNNYNYRGCMCRNCEKRWTEKYDFVKKEHIAR